MFNLQPYHDKTVQSIDHRQGGEQIIIHFTDGSFLIITGRANTGAWKMNATAELEFSGRALDNPQS